MTTKSAKEDYQHAAHVHAVTLPTGEEVTTGPAIYEPGATESPAGAMGPPAGTSPAPPMTMRAPCPNCEKSFRDCVDSVLAREDFHPREGKTREEAARAICASKEGGPAAGGKAVTARDPEAEFVHDRLQAKLAAENLDAALLPLYGRTIHERMRTSALRVIKGARAEVYAEALAWRAIRQKYKLKEFANGLSEGTDQEEATPEATQEAKALIKSATLSIARSEGGGSFLVPVAPHRNDELSAYREVITLPVPIASGVAVRVGLAHLGRQIIDVRVPKSVIGAKDDDLARAEAVNWVRRNWPSVWAVAKHLVRPGAEYVGQEKRQGSAWMHRSKFVLRPDQARQRIVYLEAYAPWEVDLQRQYATEEEVERIAHGFMLRRGKIGEMHGRWRMPDGAPPGEVVESFLAREGDQDFTPGAWGLAIKCHPRIWQKVLSGEYTGGSIGGRWGVEPVSLVALLN